ncbi:response regulator [Magnetococcales bacterium HHB-1]
MALDWGKLFNRFVVDAKEHIQSINKELLALEHDPKNQTALGSIFRSAHTIKGSARMIKMVNLSQLAHAMESVFGAMRDEKITLDEEVSDLLFTALDQLEDRLNAASEKGEGMEPDQALLDQLEQAALGQSIETKAAPSPSQTTEASSPEPEAPPALPKKPGVDWDKLINRFTKEAVDQMAQVKNDLSQFNETPEKKELLTTMIRVTNKIKGSARMVKLVPLALLVQGIENIFDDLREEHFTFSESLFILLNRAITRIQEILKHPQPGQDAEEIDETLIQLLQQAGEGKLVDGAQIPTQGTTEKPPPLAPQDRIATPVIEKPQPPAKNPTEQTKKVAETPSGIARPVATIKRPQPKKAPPQPKPEKRKPKRIATAKDMPGKKGKSGGKSGEIIRMDAANLDDLIRISGRMVMFRSRMKQRLTELSETALFLRNHIQLPTNNRHLSLDPDRSIIEAEHDDYQESLQQLNERIDRMVSSAKEDLDMLDLVFMELQDKALKLRMLPLSSLFDSFPRLIRDASKALGKKVRLDILGRETELDRNIIEKLNDPLIHMIRNAVDHGIEKTEERVQVNKPPVGKIKLSAWPEGNSVWIKLEDDGRGIPIERLKEKALAKQVISSDELKRKSDAELVNLIFHPGMSTSAIITDFSGRGVGMDVVHKNIVEELSGSIEVFSKEGQGSTFLMRLPLTMATIRVLLFQTSTRNFAMASQAIREVHRLAASEVIEVVGRPAIRLREKVVPIIFLDETLGLEPSHRTGNLTILIISSGLEKLGIVVDTIVDEEVMVLKPFPYFFRNSNYFSGVLISGKNEIVLVLEASMLLQMAKKHQMKKKISKQEAAAEKKKAQEISLLVVDDSLNTRELEKDILEAHDFDVDIAVDGEDAWEKVFKKQYSLIVTDVEMPNMNGFALTEKLRQTNEYRDTPIIIVTSLDKEEDKQRGIEVGANAYIVKSAFDEFNLVDTVQSLLD